MRMIRRRRHHQEGEKKILFMIILHSKRDSYSSTRYWDTVTVNYLSIYFSSMIDVLSDRFQV